MEGNSLISTRIDRLEECGCDDDRDILSILRILAHYTFRVIEDAFAERRYFSEPLYNVLRQAADSQGKDQFLNKLESKPETVFAPALYQDRRRV